MLEELVELGLLEYDAHVINIGAGEQFWSGFVDINPNSKVPSRTGSKNCHRDLMLA